MTRYLPLLLIALALVLRVLFVRWLQPWWWALSMIWTEKRLHDDAQLVDFFYRPEGLNMLAFMTKREDGMRWVYDPIGLPVAPPAVRRVAP